MKSILIRLFLLLALATFPLAGWAQAPQPTRLSPEVTTSLSAHSGLVYATYGERTLELDLWRPRDQTEALPAIICIHGGGWFKGERANMANFAQALAARGYVTVAISYRLSGEAKFPAAIHDAKAAVRWLRAHAADYGIRAGAIGVTGLSAGGHLAALLATSGGVAALEGAGGNPTHSSAVQACVAMGAQSDLESERIGELSARPNDPFYRTFLGASQAEQPEVYALASPRHHLEQSDPPLLFVTGEKDDPSTHAEATRADLEALGIPAGLVILPNAPHGFLGQQAAFDQAVQTCDEFFRRLLK